MKIDGDKFLDRLEAKRNELFIMANKKKLEGDYLESMTNIDQARVIGDLIIEVLNGDFEIKEHK